MEARAFRGVWIPASVWLAKDLLTTDKVLLAEVDSLEGKKGCWASNGYLAEFLGVSERYIRERLRVLEEKGYVTTKTEANQRLIFVNRKTEFAADGGEEQTWGGGTTVPPKGEPQFPPTGGLLYMDDNIVDNTHPRTAARRAAGKNGDHAKSQETKPTKAAPAVKVQEMAEAFRAAYQAHCRRPYAWNKADFVQLARFTKQHPEVSPKEFAERLRKAWGDKRCWDGLFTIRGAVSAWERLVGAQGATAASRAMDDWFRYLGNHYPHFDYEHRREEVLEGLAKLSDVVTYRGFTAALPFFTKLREPVTDAMEALDTAKWGRRAAEAFSVQRGGG